MRPPYLAAARALLLQLREAPGADRKAVDAVIGKIEVDMLANGALLTPVHSDDRVRPDVERRLFPELVESLPDYPHEVQVFGEKIDCEA
jgi:hypothetical protein